jgi:hypothetical protein
VSAPLFDDGQRKRYEHARAQGALAGLVVQAYANDRGQPEFLITQGAHTVFCESLNHLEARLERFRPIERSV